MKLNKTICIDAELIEQLKEVENGSKLINDLLMDYFNSIGQMKIDELKQRLSKKKIEMEKAKKEIEEIDIQIKELTKKEEKLEKQFSKVPKDIMDDFKAFPNMTEEILHMRFKDVYSEQFDITYPELKKAWKTFNEQEI